MKTLKVSTLGLLATLAVSFGLSACAPVMVGSMLGGAMVASDRRTAGIQLEDEGIEMRSASAIKESVPPSPLLSARKIKQTYLIVTLIVSVQRISDKMPMTFSSNPISPPRAEAIAVRKT